MTRRTQVTRNLIFLVTESVLLGAFLMTGVARLGKQENVLGLICLTAAMYLAFRVFQLCIRIQDAVRDTGDPYEPPDRWGGPPTGP